MTLNNSIAFIVDPQIQYSNPSSRIDNYFETILKKLQEVLFANKYSVILGDFTEFPVLDMAGLIAVISLLKKYKEAGGHCYSLVGNHDTYNYSLSQVNKCTLGLLAKLGLITIIDRTHEVDNSVGEIDIGDWNIQCTYLKDPRKDLKVAKQEKSILIGHNYYNFERDKKHSLEYEDLEPLQYKFIFLGHDHKNHLNKVIGKSILYRSGNLSRGRAESYNFDRKIYYYRLNLDNEQIEQIDVEFQPASEVFSIQANEKHNDPTPKYIYDLEELMNSFKKKKTANISIKKMLEDNKEVSNEIVEFIKDCYSACGIEFV